MSLSRPTREKINNFVVWWNFHSDKVASYPLDRKVDWMMQAVNSQNEILVEVCREVDGQPEMRLALPRNFTFTGAH